MAPNPDWQTLDCAVKWPACTKYNNTDVPSIIIYSTLLFTHDHSDRYTHPRWFVACLVLPFSRDPRLQRRRSPHPFSISFVSFQVLSAFRVAMDVSKKFLHLAKLGKHYIKASKAHDVPMPDKIFFSDKVCLRLGLRRSVAVVATDVNPDLRSPCLPADRRGGTRQLSQ